MPSSSTESLRLGERKVKSSVAKRAVSMTGEAMGSWVKWGLGSRSIGSTAGIGDCTVELTGAVEEGLGIESCCSEPSSGGGVISSK